QSWRAMDSKRLCSSHYRKMVTNISVMLMVDRL
ncbi:MAG: hypothetical protein ACI9JO_001516, partial [Psychrobacter okhotskensis]